ncbi:hypothetical protein JMJ76_0003351, partial [Colletotrichum scovillei]
HIAPFSPSRTHKALRSSTPKWRRRTISSATDIAMEIARAAPLERSRAANGFLPRRNESRGYSRLASNSFSLFLASCVSSSALKLGSRPDNVPILSSTPCE